MPTTTQRPRAGQPSATGSDHRDPVTGGRIGHKRRPLWVTVPSHSTLQCAQEGRLNPRWRMDALAEFVAVAPEHLRPRVRLTNGRQRPVEVVPGHLVHEAGNV